MSSAPYPCPVTSKGEDRHRHPGFTEVTIQHEHDALFSITMLLSAFLPFSKSNEFKNEKINYSNKLFFLVLASYVVVNC